MRDESEWTVEFLKRRPSERSSKSPSSHVSIWVLCEVIEAMRAAKERLLAAMLGGARNIAGTGVGEVGVQDLRERH
jgi:chemotaxis receptor (MCP) glutamine deamidase CheD